VNSADIARHRLGIGPPPIIRRPDNAIIAPARRTQEDGPLTALQAANARRYSEYIARRQGVKEPLVQIRRP